MELPPRTGDNRRAKVRLAGGPPNGVRLITEGINAVAAAAPPLGGGGVATAVAADALTAPAGGSDAAPMPVYDLGLDDLAAGGGVEKAQQRSWLYLLYANDKLTRCADLSVAPAPAGGGEPRFAGVTTAYVRELDAALHAAEGVDDDGEYELRLLRATPVHSAAVWLKRTDAVGDRFLLLPPVTKKDPTPTPFTAAELFDHWQARAKERKAQIAQAVADAAPSN